MVKKNGALLDRCNVNLFARARRLHFIGRKKSGKQEALGFKVDSFTTLFLKIVAQGHGMRSVGYKLEIVPGLLKCSRWFI